jgi:hypothetical protein
MTHGAMGIRIESELEGEQIIKALTSEKFKKDVLESCSFSSYRIDWNIFKDFKNNFWKRFYEFEKNKSVTSDITDN